VTCGRTFFYIFVMDDEFGRGRWLPCVLALLALWWEKESVDSVVPLAFVTGYWSEWNSIRSCAFDSRGTCSTLCSWLVGDVLENLGGAEYESWH